MFENFALITPVQFSFFYNSKRHRRLWKQYGFTVAVIVIWLAPSSTFTMGTGWGKVNRDIFTQVAYLIITAFESTNTNIWLFVLKKKTWQTWLCDLTLWQLGSEIYRDHFFPTQTWLQLHCDLKTYFLCCVIVLPSSLCCPQIVVLVQVLIRTMNTAWKHTFFLEMTLIWKGLTG